MLNEKLAKGCELASFLNCATSGLRTLNQAEIYFSMQWNVKLIVYIKKFQNIGPKINDRRDQCEIKLISIKRA